MSYSKEDIIRMVKEEDVEFIRLQFTDIFGQLKNVAITASQIENCLLYTSNELSAPPVWGALDKGAAGTFISPGRTPCSAVSPSMRPGGGQAGCWLRPGRWRCV